ncbi:Gfo/Idh/MocA family oxidoreductase [Pontiella sp.]|uniref:Gfo/Idh/MocA family oxidoreductase n=1 Tax=Pontiella sp. TaxID=2837462 RepID=UPI00356B1571
MNRRWFVGGVGAGAVVLPRWAGAQGSEKKLRIACIGVGNKGFGDIQGLKSETVVALCDVEPAAIAKAKTVYPDAKTYADFRVMLRAVKDEIDAVTISTPDHIHFPAAMMALMMGKHVYVQKPLAHSIWEIRQLMAEARKQGVVTQMGNQGHAFEGIRLIREWAEAGLVGEIKEVIAWTNRPKAYGFIPERTEYPPATPVPETLDWDLWCGPVVDAPPYAKGMYHPIRWRGWWTFGMGGLGDIGCHTLDTPFWALDLEVAHKVDVVVDHVNGIFTPPGSVVTYRCKQRKTGKTIPLTWYEGPKVPPKPELFGEQEFHKEGGLMLVGTKGIIYHPNMRPDSPRLFPESLWQAFKTTPAMRPAKVYPRIKGGHIAEWLRACKGEGPAPGSNFDYAGPLTEMIALGTLAIRTGKALEYDAEKMEINGNPAASELVQVDAKQGFRVADLRV